MTLYCLRFMVMAVFAFGLAACAGSRPIADGSARAVTATANLPAPDTTASDGAYTGVSEYHIGPHDLIQIEVFQVSELNRDVRVNSSGMVSLPLIGAVRAGGKTVQELEKEIAGKLGAGFLQNPQVSVFVKEFTSQRVTVEGAVKKPGIFPITGRTSLLQAVAMAEGLDPLADPNAVVIFRVIAGKKMAAMFDIAMIRSGEVEDPLIYGDDIVVIEKSGTKSFLKGLTDTLRGFVGFRTY